MSKNISVRRRISASVFILLSIIMLMYYLHGGTARAEESDDAVVVLTASDYQASKASDGPKYVKAIGDVIAAAGIHPCAFLFLGDEGGAYPVASDNEGLNKAIQTMKNAVLAAFPTVLEGRMIICQGNHDFIYPGYVYDDGGISSSGAHDTEEYGVFLINEYSYSHRNDESPEGRQAETQKIAEQLNNYLENKLKENYKKPVFITTHLPLHATSRNAKNSEDPDALYASYLFDVINSAAEKGLNIVFLYGHNHLDKGYDDYLGGSAVCLVKGDIIPVFQPDKTVVNEEINFTYMNGGFIGYYDSEIPKGSTARERLSMCTFTITEDTMTVQRWNSKGRIMLKNKGQAKTVPAGVKADEGIRKTVTVNLNDGSVEVTPSENVIEADTGGAEKVSYIAIALYEGNAMIDIIMREYRGVPVKFTPEEPYSEARIFRMNSEYAPVLNAEAV